MSEFSDLYLEFRMNLDDPDTFDSEVSAHLRPDLVDQLRAYAAARKIAFPLTIMKALEFFMVSAAEDAWRELLAGATSGEASKAAALDVVLARFLTAGLDDSGQRLLEGPMAISVATQFKRIPEE